MILRSFKNGMIINQGFIFIFIRNVLLGQAISFLNSLTGVWSTLLVNGDSSYPLLQTLTGYLSIWLAYMPLFIYFRLKYKRESFSNFQFLYRPWKYALLGLVDLEGNFLSIKAYQYTDILSIQLLSCLTVPIVFLLSVFILHSSFGFSHIFGSALALGGLIFLILKDYSQDYSVTGKSRAVGDVLCVSSSFCYALSNVLSELFVKPKKQPPQVESPKTDLFEENREPEISGKGAVVGSMEGDIVLEEIQDDFICNIPAVEVEALSEEAGTPQDIGEEVEERERVPPCIPVMENLAMMSTFGVIFATAQFFAVEWKTFSANKEYWTGMDWAYQIIFGVNMLILYTLMPTLFILCSACFVNVSLLTVNLFGFFFNALIFKEPVSHYIYVPIILIVVGLVFFNITDLISSPILNSIDQPWKKSLKALQRSRRI